MGKKVPIEVPLTGETDHPVVINLVFNDAMKRWDVELLTGNFKSENAAREMAEYLREMMEERLGSREVRKH
jgi:hypothetical protein